MAQVLIRELESDVMEKLKVRAERNNRSPEAELRIICRAAVQEGNLHILDEVLRVRARFNGRTFTDSTLLLREDRER